ncbi:hypothetical protein MMC13_005312 [Lambiella insularis]|nr:hypothetical protein [Lambiella insularis]
MTEQYYELDPHGDLVLILKADSHVVHEKSNDSSNIENDEQADTSLPVTNSESLEQGEVRMRVSSKHLALASKVFKLMLKPGYLEGNKLLSQGYVELPLPDDNQAALLILMNLIHGKLKKVPRKITLEMLTELAILVDKYELLEITEVFRDCWFEDLKTSIPQEFNQDLLPWLCISWVFAETEVFRRVTMIAKMESEGTVEEYRLPIPCAVLGKIPAFT